MAMRGTPANKIAASRLHLEEPISPDDPDSDTPDADNPDANNLSSQDSDDGGAEGSSTPNATPQPNTIKMRISGAPALYTKAWYIGLSKRPGWVPFFYIKVISGMYPAYIQDLTLI